MSQSSRVTTPGNSVAPEARRSTRIDKSIPLIVLGQNRMGEPFMERTTSVSLSMHGCRYSSRHDCGIGSWVTLQVVALNDPEQKPAEVRAMIRSIHAPSSLRELHQVGVEFETPANVWGIATPPADWLRMGETATSSAPAPASAPSPPAPKMNAVSCNEIQIKSQPKLAEVASFPPTPTVLSKGPAPKELEPARPQRVVVTPDGLLFALQGRLQQEAEKAVQAAVSKQVNEAVREALKSVDEVRQMSLRQVQDLLSKRMQEVTASSKEAPAEAGLTQWEERIKVYRNQVEEMARCLDKQTADLRRELANVQQYVEKMREFSPRLQARLDEAVAHAKSSFDETAARVVDRRHELLLEGVQTVTQEALLKLDARAAEMQALVQSAVNSGLEIFRRQAELLMNTALGETKERAVSALSSLDAESRASHEAKRQMLEEEVARSTERSMEQFRKGMKAFLYSCLVAAVSAVDEHSKATLDGLQQDNGRAFHEALREAPTQHDAEVIPDPDSNNRLTH